MNKSDWEKRLGKIKRDKGHRSPEYKREYLKFQNVHGKPGRGLPKPGDPTNGKKPKPTGIRGFFGQLLKNDDDV